MADYEPTKESLATHRVPEWFENAKFGIFIHWGLYSVPGWAPLEADTQELMATKGPAYWLKHNPYAEWYQTPSQSRAARHSDTTPKPMAPTSLTTISSRCSTKR
ncbi:alpha-L-fucosidase [Mycobacterium ostraviense]|uniref:alpha-L-fucosidase n=1 Tax=Mycobacterium ostraviense TaxID=2738409 RepID=UPI000AFAAFBB|nr:alpha-L-fucosidase [Mycobacterium ostraviense]